MGYPRRCNGRSRTVTEIVLPGCCGGGDWRGGDASGQEDAGVHSSAVLVHERVVTRLWARIHSERRWIRLHGMRSRQVQEQDGHRELPHVLCRQVLGHGKCHFTIHLPTLPRGDVPPSELAKVRPIRQTAEPSVRTRMHGV